MFTCMFSPKCYTLINKMYDPKKDIIDVRNKLNEWNDKLGENLDEYNNIIQNIYLYIDCSEFPDMIDIPFYDETLEGWTLIKKLNKLKREYPRHYKQVLAEEVTKEDDQIK